MVRTLAAGALTVALTSIAASPAVAASSTAAGLKKAKWGNNVTVTFSKTQIRLRSNGIPNHPRPAQYALPNAGAGNAIPTAATATAGDDPTRAQSYDFQIPTTPTRAAKTTAAPLGSIGFMISGAVLFNPYEGDGKTVAMANNFTVKGADGTDVPFVDSCSGHPNPIGQYHYHALPACISAVVDGERGPSHILGVAFDGYPIYGARDSKGRKVSVAKLDKCNGITSATPEFPKGIYHYVLPGTTDATSSIRCFRGKVGASLITRMPAMGGGPPPGRPPAAAAATTVGVQSRLLCDLA